MTKKQVYEAIEEIVNICKKNEDCYSCPLCIKEEIADRYNLATICKFTEALKILDEETPSEIELDALKEVIEL